MYNKIPPTFPHLKELVLKWALDKGILGSGTLVGQSNKTIEEAHEILDSATLLELFPDRETHQEEIIDAIGDTAVTLIILAEMLGTTVEYCLEQAYKVIAKRQGKMVNGVFVKEENHG
jgi:NTP pyrophosphatase (non-canonical NTP hydrolase)